MNKCIFAAAAAAAFAVAGCEPDNQATVGENSPVVGNEALPGGGAALPLEANGLTVAQKEEVGAYVADSDGRALYVLLGTRQQDGQQGADAARCTGPCLEAWPPFRAQGAPGAGPNVDASKVGTTSSGGIQQVTYAGWPLYYYEADRVPMSTSGHGTTDEFGEWSLISPEGELITMGGNPGKAPT